MFQRLFAVIGLQVGTWEADCFMLPTILLNVIINKPDDCRLRVV